MADKRVGRKRASKVPIRGDDGLAFGERLRNLREARGWEHMDVASRTTTRLSSQAISKYENNLASEPGFFNGIAIADALGVSPHVLAGKRPFQSVEVINNGTPIAPNPSAVADAVDALESRLMHEVRDLRKQLAESTEAWTAAAEQIQGRLEAPQLRLGPAKSPKKANQS